MGALKEYGPDGKISRVVALEPTHRLADFGGGDALARSPVDLRAEVQKYAIAALPFLFKKAMVLVETARTSKDQLEALKFIKALADGEIRAKDVSRRAAEFSNEELAEVLRDVGPDAD